MSLHGDAYALAIMLYVKSPDTSYSEQADALYEVVEASGLGDEAKADLYARLAEQLTSETKFAAAVEAIEQALIRTRRRYPHG